MQTLLDTVKIPKLLTKNMMSVFCLMIINAMFLTGVKGVYNLHLHIYKHNLVYTYSIILVLG